MQETIETPVNEEADVEEAEETDEVQNAEEEVNEQDAVDEIIEEIESSGKSQSVLLMKLRKKQYLKRKQRQHLTLFE